MGPSTTTSYPSTASSSNKPQPSIASMHPPTPASQTTNNPGLVDLPTTCISPAEVASKKAKKAEALATAAKTKEAKVAQVARVEQEIKIAQKEATRPSRQVKPRAQVKRTFLRPVSDEDKDKDEDEDEEAMRARVSKEVMSISVTCQMGDPCNSPYLPKAACLESAMAVTQNPSASLKRKAATAQLFDELERTASVKVAK